MDIPKELKIGGHIVRVFYPYEFKERSDLNGQFDKGLSEIRIAESDACGARKSESEIMVTFLHEILHAIDYCTGHRMFEGDDGERYIEGISEGLYQVLKDNKLVFF